MFYKSWHTARLTGLVGLGLPVWLQLASSLASIRKLIRVYAWWSKWTAFCAPKGEHTGDNTAPSAEFVSGNQLARARLLGYCARVHGSIGALHCSKSGSKRTNVALRIMSSLRYDACHHDSLTLISHSQLGKYPRCSHPAEWYAQAKANSKDRCTLLVNMANIITMGWLIAFYWRSDHWEWVFRVPFYKQNWCYWFKNLECP